MTRNKRTLLVSAASLAGILAVPQPVQARGGTGFRVGVVVRESYAFPRYAYGWPECGSASFARDRCSSGPYDIGAALPFSVNGIGLRAKREEPIDWPRHLWFEVGADNVRSRRKAEPSPQN